VRLVKKAEAAFKVLPRFARNDDVGCARATNRPDGQISKNLSSPREKNIPLNRANQRYLLAPSHPMRGALRNVTNARWDAVDAEACEDERS